VAHPLMVFFPMSTWASSTPLTEPDALTSSVDVSPIGYVKRPSPERWLAVSSTVVPLSSVTP
jgi:hypothetical protein